MILQALHQYYQQMRAAGSDIAPPGMEWKEIPFVIDLTPEGEVIQLADTRDKEHKKGCKYLVSKSATRSGTNAYQVAQVMWDHPGYVLGISKDGSEKEAKVAPLQNQYFVEKVRALLERYPTSPHILAVAKFYQEGHALKLSQDETQMKVIQSLTGANLSFRVPELSPALVASTKEVEAYMTEPKSSDTETSVSHTGVCLVTGLNAPLARLHPSVKLLGAQATASLISFQKASGFDSYGKEQGFNAPISTQAAEAIATALNDLLTKDRYTNYRVGENTFVFWSNLPNEDLLRSYRLATFSGNPNLAEKTEDEETPQESVEATPKRGAKSKRARKPVPIDPSSESYQVLQTLKAACGQRGGRVRDGEGRFYILGLAPNAGRISIKLWAEGSISEIVGHTLQHQHDMNIISREGNLNPECPPLRSVYQIINSVSSSDKSDKWSANLIQSIVESIIGGKPYPHSLQQACLERLKRNKPVTELRAAILKAYINRKKQQEYITMALDPNQTDKAYLAGRLFALLENIQQHALGTTNTTIRDAYYSAASTTPQTIFKLLNTLSQAHFSKLRKTKTGLAVIRDRQIAEIYDKIPGGASGFPVRFSLDDQSIFAAGYYHQRTELWRKKEVEEVEVENSSEDHSE